MPRRHAESLDAHSTRRRAPTLAAALLAFSPAAADELDDAGRLFRSGRYRECIAATATGVEGARGEEAWHALRIRALLAVGDHAGALEALDRGLKMCRESLELRLLANDVALLNDDPERAAAMLERVDTLARGAPWRYRDAASLVTAGRARLLRGFDAKEVIEGYFDPAKELDPELAAPHVATAELALEKHDYALAAEALQRALALAPEDPDVHLLVARAFAPTDGREASAALARALEINPNHASSLLVAVDQRLSAELFEEARGLLERVLAVDPHHWQAWAYRAVLAHLDADAEAQAECRAQALASWKKNPGVDHLVGRELSERYRFAEGAAFQRRALELDEHFLPARFQLAQDLLRLGAEAEGWKLADGVSRDDPYNVVAYNLMVLHDELAAYRTLATDAFVVRMEPLEAEVYGELVLELLERARAELCPKYRVELDAATILELFAEQKDFAIRTFGLPGGEGFLGVCFGDVVTMKSPAAQGESPANWQAVLWHEFCHVVTLNKTANRMPRWLSEGISVFEERQREPSWGQGMNPAYRERILAGGATPVSALSSAFQSPDGPLGLQFAYYESSMVVEYIVATSGLDALLAVLDDLGAGASLERSLGAHVAPLDELDRGFEEYLRGVAEAFAPDATWEPFEERDPDALLARAAADPNSVPGLQQCARALIDAGRGDEALAPLERSLELCPELVGEESAYALLAEALAGTGDEERELDVLVRWAARDADSLAARRRLMTLLEARSDWPGLFEAAASALAIQPMAPEAHRRLVAAASELGRAQDVVRSGRALLALGPVDPAEVHFQIARARAELGDLAGAKGDVLRALEEAPRFRLAHELLLELVERSGEAPERRGR